MSIRTLDLQAKKSVALSGTPAGNAALCAVRAVVGNDLHYRGYDIKGSRSTLRI